MIVRYARAGDAGALISLARATRAAGAALVPGLSAGSLRGLLAAAEERPDQVLVAVAEDGGGPVGFIAAFIQNDAVSPHANAICDRLHVAPARRGAPAEMAPAETGLAEIALVGALVDWARKRGAPSVLIDAATCGADPGTARRLEALGFEYIGPSLGRSLGTAPRRARPAKARTAPAMNLEPGVDA